MRYLAPLLLFVALCAALAAGLRQDPRHIPSPLVGKPAPAFLLPHLQNNGQTASAQTFAGKVWLLNVWASWCVACLREHPLLLELLQGETLIGLNYKDEPAAAKQWLARWGDPYDLSLADEAGKVGLDWGVYGVPETFVIDQNGVIRHKHIGPLSRQDIAQTILPLVQQLKKQ